MGDHKPSDRPPAAGLEWLCAALGHADPRGRRVVIDTRRSQVLLTGAHAVKFRRAVPPLASARARRGSLEEELCCNRRVSPSVYLGVVPIPSAEAVAVVSRGVSEQSPGVAWAGRPPRGAPLPGASLAAAPLPATSLPATTHGPLDWALVMRRLPRGRMLDRAIRAGTVSCADIDRLGLRLARLYRETRPDGGPDGGSDGIGSVRVLARIDREQARNRRQLLRLASELASPFEQAPAAARLAELLDRSDAAWRSHRAEVAARVKRGLIVEAHGDLRPEHVCLTEPIELIDRLEFDRSLQYLDPWEELGLLGLLCSVAGGAWIGPRLAQVLHQRWAPPSPGLLAFYCTHHALVRARLALSHLGQPEAKRQRHWRAVTRRLLGYAGAALEGWDCLAG